MATEKEKSSLSNEIQNFLRTGFTPHFGEPQARFRTNPVWRRFQEIGSELWLDTGSIADAEQCWTQEFSGLTTNNTLLNKEIQTGRYDWLVSEVAHILAKYPQISEQERMLETAFVLNAWHGLRLVEKFDSRVSVEKHTALANTVEQAVYYARRFHAVCPDRFIVKIPFTPAGLLATRRLSADRIAVNHTLGFSARQNYIIARIAEPTYVNVFLGRLNSFVADNNLGSGAYVGEKAVLASQGAINGLRQLNLSSTRQIGASFRTGKQVWDLAGLDVMTMPPKVAGELESIVVAADRIVDRTDIKYQPGLHEKSDIDTVRLDTLWEIGPEVVRCVEALLKEDLDTFAPNDLLNFFKDHHCSDVLVDWKDSEIATSAAEGKIPRLQNWRHALADKSIGLDSLMTLAGLNSFAADQKAMDQRLKKMRAAPTRV